MRKGKLGVLYIIACFLLCFALVMPSYAEEQTPWADASVSVLTAYIWRGIELSRDSIVVQPTMSVGYYGFYANFWANIDTNPYTADDEGANAKWNESDFTIAYGTSFGILNVEGGYIYYALDSVDDSQEVFASLGVDTILSPTLTVYKEFARYPSWYFLFGISHSFAFTDFMSLDLSASASYLLSDDADDYPEVNDNGEPTGDEFSNFHDGVLSASLPISFAKYFTVAPTISYVFPITDDAKNQMQFFSKNGESDQFVYGGISVGFAF
ncbi:MAG: hypothetical protein HY788_06000 [Deltaproteobacteria bacterium]|nr:hypothetical protein [Deltaproteobacteria bacterium]